MSSYQSSGKRARAATLSQRKEQKVQARADKRGRPPRELQIASSSEVQGGMPSIEVAMQAIENPGSVERTAPSISVRLFVGSLSDSTTVTDLRSAFEAYGPVVDAVIMVDRDTGQSRGFGFVTMASRKDSRVIEALNGAELNGRSIVVNVATERGR